MAPHLAAIRLDQTRVTRIILSNLNLELLLRSTDQASQPEQLIRLRALSIAQIKDTANHEQDRSSREAPHSHLVRFRFGQWPDATEARVKLNEITQLVFADQTRSAAASLPQFWVLGCGAWTLQPQSEQPIGTCGSRQEASPDAIALNQ